MHRSPSTICAILPIMHIVHCASCCSTSQSTPHPSHIVSSCLIPSYLDRYRQLVPSPSSSHPFSACCWFFVSLSDASRFRFLVGSPYISSHWILASVLVSVYHSSRPRSRSQFETRFFSGIHFCLSSVHTYIPACLFTLDIVIDSWDHRVDVVVRTNNNTLTLCLSTSSIHHISSTASRSEVFCVFEFDPGSAALLRRLRCPFLPHSIPSSLPPRTLSDVWGDNI